MIIGFSILGVAVIIAALFLIYVYVPTPKEPALSSVSHKNTMEVGNLSRTYISYHPKMVKPSPALLIVLHGTGIDGAKVREWTGYESNRWQINMGSWWFTLTVMIKTGMIAVKDSSQKQKRRTLTMWAL